MVEIQPNGVGVGLLFPYEQGADPDDLKEWAEERKFDVQNGEQGIGVGMGPDGLMVRGPGPFAAKGNIQILYNPAADLKGYAESSFITIKDNEGGDYETVSNLLEELHESFEGFAPDDVTQYELTYNGRVRINRDKHDFSTFFDQSHLDAVGDLGSGANGVVAVFESETDSAKEDGWFTFVFDTLEVSNPRLWSYKLTRRYDEFKDINLDNLNETITGIVDRTTGEN